MTSFPDTIYTHRTRENKNGVAYAPEKLNVIFAEDLNYTDDEIISIENELGILPKNTSVDVAERIKGFRSFADAESDVVSIFGDDVVFGNPLYNLFTEDNEYAGETFKMLRGNGDNGSSYVLVGDRLVIKGASTDGAIIQFLNAGGSNQNFLGYDSQSERFVIFGNHAGPLLSPLFLTHPLTELLKLNGAGFFGITETGDVNRIVFNGGVPEFVLNTVVDTGYIDNYFDYVGTHHPDDVDISAGFKFYTKPLVSVPKLALTLSPNQEVIMGDADVNLNVSHVNLPLLNLPFPAIDACVITPKSQVDTGYGDVPIPLGLWNGNLGLLSIDGVQNPFIFANYNSYTDEFMMVNMKLNNSTDVVELGGDFSLYDGSFYYDFSANDIIANGNLTAVGAKVNFASLPTSDSGIDTGDLWNNNGVVNVKI